MCLQILCLIWTEKHGSERFKDDVAFVAACAEYKINYIAVALTVVADDIFLTVVVVVVVDFGVGDGIDVVVTFLSHS